MTDVTPQTVLTNSEDEVMASAHVGHDGDEYFIYHRKPGDDDVVVVRVSYGEDSSPMSAADAGVMLAYSPSPDCLESVIGRDGDVTRRQFDNITSVYPGYWGACETVEEESDETFEIGDVQ